MRYSVRKEKFQLWFAGKMPRWVVYWCSIRLMAWATQGKNSGVEVPSVTIIEALNVWEK